MSRKSKKAIIYGSISCILAIGFALLYYFNIIKTLDSFLSLTYVAYFVSLGLIFVGSYQKECANRRAELTANIFGFICLLASTIMLIYGFATGLISFVG